MKKSLLIILVAVLTVCLFGCKHEITKEEKESIANEAIIKELEKQASENPIASALLNQANKNDEAKNDSKPVVVEAKIGDSIQVGDAVISITKTFHGKTMDDKNVVGIIYSWTNNSSDTKTAESCIGFKAFQDGIEQGGVTMIGAAWDSSAGHKDVKAGATQKEVISTFYADSQNEFEIDIYIQDGIFIKDQVATLKIPFPENGYEE